MHSYCLNCKNLTFIFKFYLKMKKPIPPASEPAIIQLLKLVIREFVVVHANVFMCVQASSSP